MTDLTNFPREIREYLLATLHEYGVSTDDHLCSLALVQARMAELIEKRRRRWSWVYVLLLSAAMAIAYYCGEAKGWQKAVQTYPREVTTATEGLSGRLVEVNDALNRLNQTLAKAR